MVGPGDDADGWLVRISPDGSGFLGKGIGPGDPTRAVLDSLHTRSPCGSPPSRVTIPTASKRILPPSQPPNSRHHHHPLNPRHAAPMPLGQQVVPGTTFPL